MSRGRWRALHLLPVPGIADIGLMGLGDGSGIPHQAVAGAPPVTRDGGAFGYVAAEGPPSADGSPNLRPRRRWGDRAPRAGGPPPPCVRGHREAARHLRQAGLQVVGHVITLRELGLFEAGTSSLRCRLPAVGHFITADRKTSDFLDCITYSQIRAEAEVRGRERACRP